MRLIIFLTSMALAALANAQSDSTWMYRGTRYVLDAGIPREYLKSFDSLLTATKRFDYLSDECNLDNTIYLPEKTFVFDYYFEKGGRRFKLNTNGRLVLATDTAARTIRHIGYQIEHGNCMGMTQVKYQYRVKEGIDDLFEVSGIIENKLVTWLHPPRSLYFGSLEVLPFPYYDNLAARNGQAWHWDLLIGNENYLSFIPGNVETLNNRCTYRVVAQETRPVLSKLLPCDVVEGVARNEVGEARLKAWYNETYGFVRWEGVNVDGGVWWFELVSVEK
ncbi:MAG: hypothetical protein JNJ57_01960 [Saprospiraceae bacterium]|nr:hypothetical protein [Saprospiraceae bacterium]